MSDERRQKDARGPSDADVQVLLESADGLVEGVIAGLKRRGVATHGWDDLRAYGQQGLLEAAHRFDAHAGIPFRAYAQFRVRGAIIDGLRKMGGWSRRGYERVSMIRGANEAGEDLAAVAPATPADSGTDAGDRLRKHMAKVVTAMTVGTFHEASGAHPEAEAVDTTTDVEGRLVKFQLRDVVRAALSELPSPEDEVLRRFYILGENMDAIAADYDKSRSWVSRVHTRALGRLAARLRELRG